MIMPSALNVIIIGLSVIIFSFFWRIAAAHLSNSSTGKAMAVIL